MTGNRDLMNEITSLAKRRGFVFQGSEIYGGVGGIYDFGPRGVELVNNIKREWWKEMVYDHENIVGMDGGIIMHPKVWEASGHIDSFVDPLVECKNCHHRFRADHVEGHACPNCGAHDFTEPKEFNILVETYLGSTTESKSLAYLRGETTQSIYVNFENVRASTRQKIPFGIAQIGKAFRNEITPGNFFFRSREFEQMEMQFFVEPPQVAEKKSAKRPEEWFEEWKQARWDWYVSLGFDPKRLRFHEHPDHEKAHYAKAAFDIEYDAPWDWAEFEGIHNRSDWDLSRHSQYSGKDLSYFDNELDERYIPWIIETSAGASRMALVAMLDAYTEEEVKGETRVVLKLHPKLAPVKVAVFPLQKDERLVKIAKEIYDDLKLEFYVEYDDTGSIGKRYRRHDEIGTPFAITVDFDSADDNKVTIRDRDTMQQERTTITDVPAYIVEKLA